MVKVTRDSIVTQEKDDGVLLLINYCLLPISSIVDAGRPSVSRLCSQE